ncbi:alpha/beta hydrolase [Pseudarthrobacter sp. J75]|uniref:alpha/beta fold hydrolase n=1 Tax=unclassified Pseudarthrobacter TaxID=2647000 RepID=UPI002E813680|nr:MULTISPECIES: alpha/beta hydrolase [unclassified Pseudarthrobacter]MEE2523682.1 alpha/beta hydrolase [Pseudarthrobacter sp. J47]MEE2530073.1 alpha/beta hydrolase [Pseudarthrobacter sp. J75]
MKLTGGRDVTHFGLWGRLYSSTAVPGPAHTVGPQGAKEPPSYVLLHGIGVSHRYLARLHLELAKTGNVYTFDLPGFGDAPSPREQIQVEQYADFVAAALADEAARQMNGSPTGGSIVVGHSMGTQFAVELALRRPQLVSGVVLMSPVVDPQRGTVLKQAADLTTDALFCESPSSNITVFSDYFRAGPRWYLTELPVMMGYPLAGRTSQVQQPVLVVRGSRDPVARGRWCRELAETAPHGTLVEVPGKGHVVQHTGTAAVATAITKWASATDQGGLFTAR